MEVPLQVSFHGVDHSDAVETKIREHAEGLEKFYDRITSCRVVVEAPHGQHHKGNLYDLRIVLEVPGKEIVVKRDQGANHAHEDVYVTIRDAFRAARRELQDHVRRNRGDVKHHDAPPHGTVTRLAGDEDYGIIEASDGQEIYFHRNSVVDGGFDNLEVGQDVRFAAAEAESERGPQATTVHPVGKHHIVE